MPWPFYYTRGYDPSRSLRWGFYSLCIRSAVLGAVVYLIVRFA